MASPQPFSGVRVIDASQVLAAPYAGYQLALLGADVVKVEDPGYPDFVRQVGTDAGLNAESMGTQFLTQNAGKRFLTLNLKDERGREAFRRLLRDADVLITNARPGAFDALGLGYPQLSGELPRLVYCAVSAFGHKGSKRSYRGYENVVQATSGYMSANGTPEVRPLRQGSPAIDYGTGIAAAFAVATALFERERTGHGQFLDVAMIDVAAVLMACHVTSHLRDGFEPVPTGNRMALATTSTYRTRDGLLMVGATNDRQMRKLWSLLGREDMAKPDPFNGPAGDFDNEYQVLQEVLSERGAQEWEEFFQAHGIPAARVRETLGDALHDDQYAERGAFGPVDVPAVGEQVWVPRLPFIYGSWPAVPALPPCPPGSHSGEVLQGLGYSTDEIEVLRAAGVTSWPEGSARAGHHRTMRIRT